MKYVTVAEMVEIEQAANKAGHSYQDMMEAAGRGLAELVDDRYGAQGTKTIAALVGSGNNGGDALVALDYLLSWGWFGVVFLLRKRSPEDPLVKRVTDRGGSCFDYSEFRAFPSHLEDTLAGSDVLLDGVLGTGIKLPLRDPLDHMIGAVKRILDGLEKKPIIVAVDCPSGVDCDSGEVSPVSIPADLTVTMAAVKAGMLKFPAYGYLGDLELVGIGLPSGLPPFEKINRETVEEDWVLSRLPDRPLDAHKGSFGTSLIIGGSEEYPGAIVLAGLSAYRIGSGLVTAAVPRCIYLGVIKTLPEATWLVLDDEDGGISEPASGKIRDSLKKPTACLIGPGIGIRRKTGEFMHTFIQLKDLPPLVVDADGLRLLSSIDQWPEILPAGSVLTPHPGEMAVLTGLPVEDIQRSRLDIAEEYARRWKQIVLLKGAHTIIAAPDGRTRILVSADPALARAGSGDVLAGMITGLIAQGMDAFDAAASGSWVHARAGALAAELKGSQAAVLAGDISASIGSVLPG